MKKRKNDDELRVFDVKNILPIYNDVSTDEHQFYEYYVRFFKIEKDEKINIPYVMLCPSTMENLIIDIIRGYNHFLFKKYEIDTDKD